jgi:hypothetical protein
MMISFAPTVYQHLLYQVLKKRLERYEELAKQGIIKLPENND